MMQGLNTITFTKKTKTIVDKKRKNHYLSQDYTEIGTYLILLTRKNFYFYIKNPYAKKVREIDMQEIKKHLKIPIKKLETP